MNVRDYERRIGRVYKMAAVIETALGIHFREALSGSCYARYNARHSRGCDVRIRVSDHKQVSGGGFDESRGERRGDADLSYVAGPRIRLTVAQVRSDVARKVCEAWRANKRFAQGRNT